MTHTRYVPINPHRRKPVLGNLALALALIFVDGIRAAAILTAFALDRPCNLLRPKGRRQ